MSARRVSESADASTARPRRMDWKSSVAKDANDCSAGPPDGARTLADSSSLRLVRKATLCAVAPIAMTRSPRETRWIVRPLPMGSVSTTRRKPVGLRGPEDFRPHQRRPATETPMMTMTRARRQASETISPAPRLKAPEPFSSDAGTSADPAGRKTGDEWGAPGSQC